jgi:threonine aldolase
MLRYATWLVKKPGLVNFNEKAIRRMNSIDLRSDTVSWPTPEMREAMANADVGDDVFGDDPTVNRLEALAAEKLGKEASVFVSSGTQGNLMAILTHCGRGDEYIVGAKAHPYINEVGGAAALGGVHPWPIPIQPDGTLALDDIRNSMRDPADLHYPTTRLVTIENTNGAMGGLPLPADYTRSVKAVCDEGGLKFHIDGARIWNAAAALGVDVKELTAPADSVTFCLSKGLCAPAGSLLCGTNEFVGRARRWRKMLGGSMRQAGILAAAGIIAIEKMTQRLGEDHVNAKRLAEGLCTIPGLVLDMNQVQSNMVFFSLDQSVPLDEKQLYAKLESGYNVKLDMRGPRAFRAVTHYWITPERVDQTVNAIREVLQTA